MSLKRGKLPSSAIADLFENLSFLIDVGHPLETAVELLADSKGGRGDRSADGISAAATLLLPALRDGGSLGEALASQEERFGSIAGQVEAADEAGKLGEALVRIAEQQRNSAGLRKRVQGALMMPCVLVLMILIVSLFLFVKVLPEMIDNLNFTGDMELPYITQLMMAGSTFVITWWPFLVMGGLLSVGLLVFMINGPLKQVAHRLYTRIPVVGMVVKCHALLAFYNTLSYMIFANQALDKSLGVAALDISNLYIRRMAEAAAGYYSGYSVELGEALSRIEIIPEIERITLTAGYRANEFVPVLDTLAKNKRKELDTTLNAAIEWLTPVTTIITAVMAGLIGLAVYTPILNMGSYI